MTATRTRLAALAGLTAAGTALVGALSAAPALAHGSLTNPMSRGAGCSPDGGFAGSDACAAASAASGGSSFGDWDNERVPGVEGRDRQFVPDGELCSAGLSRYRGLDLPRTDFPTTRVTAGARFRFSYATTITHPGRFELYLTREGFDPTKRLRWSDLDSQPFLTVDEPTARNGAYTFSGRLPGGRTGHHIVYVIWRNDGTDTYYSCSDVDFGAKPAETSSEPAPPPKPAPTTSKPKPTPTPTTPSPTPTPTTTSAPPSTEPPTPTPSPTDVALAPVSSASAEENHTMTSLGVGAVAAGFAAGAIGLGVRVRRRRV